MELELDSPHLVMAKLQSIENDLAVRQNALEDAAKKWYGAKREVEREIARALLTSAHKTVTEKKAEGIVAAYDVEHAASEAEYVAVKAAVGVLEARAMICQSLLKAQGRV